MYSSIFETLRARDRSFPAQLEVSPIKMTWFASNSNNKNTACSKDAKTDELCAYWVLCWSVSASESQSKMGYRSCAFPGCPMNTGTIPKVRFHSFPAGKAKDWAQKIRSPKLCSLDEVIINKNHLICTLHFSDRMYMNRQRIRLTQSAFPDRVNESIMLDDAIQSQRVQQSYLLHHSFALDQGPQLPHMDLDGEPQIKLPSSYSQKSPVPGSEQSHTLVNQESSISCAQQRGPEGIPGQPSTEFPNQRY